MGMKAKTPDYGSHQYDPLQDVGMPKPLSQNFTPISSLQQSTSRLLKHEAKIDRKRTKMY